MLSGGALEDHRQANPADQLVEDAPNDHCVLRAVLQGEDVRQNQTGQVFSLFTVVLLMLIAAEVEECDHDFEELKHGLVQLFRSGLVFKEQSDYARDFAKEILHLGV